MRDDVEWVLCIDAFHILSLILNGRNVVLLDGNESQLCLVS
jgi:hypothetical protein